MPADAFAGAFPLEAHAPVSSATETPATSSDAQSAETPAPEKRKRRQLPAELPRRDVVHMPADVCKTCGGTELRTVSESVTEVLEYTPGRFEVIRHVRPACSCAKCETMVQAPMPELPIPRGMVDASFLAHIAVAKFCDHLPLYRQVEIYARSGLARHGAALLEAAAEAPASRLARGRALPPGPAALPLPIDSPALHDLYHACLNRLGIRERYPSPDWSIADRWVARELLETGTDPARVAAVLRHGSPGFPRRHADPEDYVRRTLHCAALFSRAPNHRSPD